MLSASLNNKRWKQSDPVILLAFNCWVPAKTLCSSIFVILTILLTKIFIQINIIRTLRLIKDRQKVIRKFISNYLAISLPLVSVFLLSKYFKELL